jgi:hypothetical protein
MSVLSFDLYEKFACVFCVIDSADSEFITEKAVEISYVSNGSTTTTKTYQCHNVCTGIFLLIQHRGTVPSTLLVDFDQNVRFIID